MQSSYLWYLPFQSSFMCKISGPQQQSDESESEDDDLIDSAISDKKPERDERRGTEIKLRNLTLKDNASTLTCGTLKVIIQCARCKNKMDVSTPSGRPNLVTCGKCSYPQVMTFRSAIMHQFSSVVGYLDLDGCIPFDLILQDCMFKLGCFSCNKEMKAKVWSFAKYISIYCSELLHDKYLFMFAALFMWIPTYFIFLIQNRVWPLDKLLKHGVPTVTVKWKYLQNLSVLLNFFLQSKTWVWIAD